MLIRWVKETDKVSWVQLAEAVSHVFGHENMAKDQEFHDYMDRKMKQFEALIAIDRMTNECLGIIGFSRTHNRISWLGVFEPYRNKGIGSKLLKTALNQLNWSKEISVITFQKDYQLGISARKLYEKFGFVEVSHSLTDNLGNPRSQLMMKFNKEKHGGSFHYNYSNYANRAIKEECPICQGIEGEVQPVLIKEMDYSWLECWPEAQGCLFGKCHVLSKVHSEHFYDLNPVDMANFMKDVQKAAEVLHKVTGAVKINYEIHGNSVPHLHVHLFPRYLDDNYPSLPINYHETKPSPYESEEEFQWFVEKMKVELNK